ncbi:MAG: penicillin acylase family protein [Proteobacteria bacterium]|nr:penicillin acylase family protein [Pseudomonadota bacterium]
MKRSFFRLLAGVVLVTIMLAVVIWLTVRASLPMLDGTISLAGLEASASIERDAAGIATITASSRADLAFATGFAHSQDRFFQMDMIRRQAAGELAEVIGEAALDLDRRFRLHRFRSRARATIATQSDNDSAVLGSYADGVNAGLASLGAKPFEYFVLGVDPESWQPEDTVLVAYAMFVQLNDSRATRDVQRGFAKRILPAEVYAWMYPQGTSWDAPLMGVARASVAFPAAETYSIRHIRDTSPPAIEHATPPLDGSNNWAVHGALTSTGRALVSNDMHLMLRTPNIYYRARLVVNNDVRRDVTGVTLPGSPFVVAGSNGKVAWGFTNSYGDWSDAVILRPGQSPDTYRTPGGDRSFDVYREVIRVKDSEPVVHIVRETIWGPVIDDVDYPDGELVVSWIAHRTGAANLRLMDLELVGSVVEALDVANTMGIPPQNFVTGDADGNIGWTIAGKIPRKSSFDAMVPTDWSEAQGWHGWLDADAYPRILNPDNGRIWTANARVTDRESLGIIGDGGYDLGARASQVRDALLARDNFEPVDMLAIQTDDRALFLTRWRELLLDVLDEETTASDPELAEYRRLAEKWIPRAAPDSVGYRLVRAFRLEVQSRVFHALTGPVRDAYDHDVRLRRSSQFEGPLWLLLREQPQHLLPGNYDSWNALLLAAVNENVRYFKTGFDGDLADRNWGERNMASIRHPLSRALPFLAGFLDMPREPLAGDSHMPKAQGRNWGASERFSVAPGDEANGLMHMPAGQSGHPLSEYYRRGHQDWVEGRATPFLPGETRHTLTLAPLGE